MTRSQREEIIAYAKALGIQWTSVSPQSYTSSVNNNPQSIMLTLSDPEELISLIRKINALNKNKEHPISTSVIGGGRGGNNHSYSIGNLWEGTDVFLQLAWQPTLTLLKKRKNGIDAVFRVSPNMMLVELNKHLYDLGYHCPVLYGALPFMSLAGGISTNSHTAQGFLADTVKGIEVLLPNGQVKYFKKTDSDFATLCQTPTLGTLGVITAIDIDVIIGKKKLQRQNIILPYHGLVSKIQAAATDKNLNSISIIFSPVKLKNNTRVKLTTWNWVDDNIADQGTLPLQAADTSLATIHVAPWVATKRPTFFYCFFQQEIMSSPGTTISRPDSIMGPESRVAGKITGMELLFAYNKHKINDFFKRLLELFDNQRTRNNFPINTAIFIRFPKKIDADKYCVAIDFISFGLHSQTLKPFINELVSYLHSTGVKSHVHYGKSDAISSNNANNTSHISWDKLKIQYHDFYRRHKLNINLLHHKINSLEKDQIHQSKKTVDDSIVCKKYLNYCNLYQLHLERKLEEQLKKYPLINYRYELDTVDHPAKFNKYHLLMVDVNNGPKSDHFLSEQEIKERKMIVVDSSISKTIKKYTIIKSLKNHLTTEKPPEIKIETFHQELDRQRKQLVAHRDSTLLKWLGVFAAGLAGLGIFSYWTTKNAYKNLFTTKAEKIILENVNEIRHEKYSL